MAEHDRIGPAGTESDTGRKQRHKREDSGVGLDEDDNVNMEAEEMLEVQERKKLKENAESFSSRREHKVVEEWAEGARRNCQRRMWKWRKRGQ